MYSVMAYRWGWLNGHQYQVYCGADLEEALRRAQEENSDRAGKYGCAVYGYSAEEDSFKLIRYFGASMHNEEEPFYNARLDYYANLGHTLHTYTEGLLYAPCADDPDFMELVEVAKPPQKLLDEVKRQLDICEKVQQAARAPAAKEPLCLSEISGESLLPCPFCGSVDLIVRTYPANDSVQAFTTHIICNASGPDPWRRCGAAQTVTRVSYAKSRQAAIKVWNTRLSPLEPALGRTT